MQRNMAILFVSLFFFVCLEVHAQDSTNVLENKYQISVERKDVFIDFDTDTISVLINSPQVPLKGFAFKVAVQSQFLNIENIIQGEFYDECRWEFFNTRQIISDFSAANYLQVWQIIGLSEIIADSISPGCYYSDSKTSLAKIIVSRNKFSNPADSIIPIFFLWEDCSDNTISGMSGNELFVSEKVIQFYDNQPQFEKKQFPTTQGIPVNCTKASALNAPVKGIDLLHGGVLLIDRNLDDSLILDK